MTDKPWSRVATQWRGWELSPQSSSYRAEFFPQSHKVNYQLNAHKWRIDVLCIETYLFEQSQSFVTIDQTEFMKCLHDIFWVEIGPANVNAITTVDIIYF